MTYLYGFQCIINPDLVLGSMVSGGLLGATLSFSGQWFRSTLSNFELAFWPSLHAEMPGVVSDILQVGFYLEQVR